MAEARYADKRYYTDAKRERLVEEGSEEAAYLVVGEGGVVTDEMAEKYGIKGRAREERPEEPGIVVSGGRDTGPAFVKAEAAVAGEDAPSEAQAGAEDDESPAAKKAGAKKGATGKK